MQASKKDVEWYNNFYKNGIKGKKFSPWYTFMLRELVKEIKKDSTLLELGCGQSSGLRFLSNNNYINQKNIYGLDQSIQPIISLKKELPQAILKQGDIYNSEYQNDTFDYILLMEVIEHLEKPLEALEEISRILKPGGKLYLSFPNYLNFPWLMLRILAKKLNKPNWLVLQPVDKIYTTINIINLCKKINLKYQKIIGSNYYPPIFHKYENKKITIFLNRLGFNHLSLHPTLIFKK